jgi:hypothetical protein
MTKFRVALLVALLPPGTAVAETAVHMPSLGFRYTTQTDADATSASGIKSKSHSMLHREVIASDGTTIQTRNEGTIGDPGSEFSVSGKTTYRLSLLIDTESTARPISDQPPVTNGTTWDCPADGLDQFYPRGTAAQVSLTCKITVKLNGQVRAPEPVTVSVSDLGPAHDTTLAGTFDVRKIVVRTSTVGITNEIIYDFAPALGISVVQETKVSTPHGETVTHSEVADFTPAP